jgi:protein-tyrosine phosphatase
VASQEQTMDASNVATRLWVGARPPFDCDLPRFDVLVLCAEELQPERLAFHGLVIRCPIPDATLSNAELTRALLASSAVADALSRGQRVLVTCAAGINRSALVAALALARITRMGAVELMLLMRQRRHPMALSNPYFQQVLHKLVGDGRQG